VIRRLAIAVGVVLTVVASITLSGHVRLLIGGVTTQARIVKISGSAATYEFADLAEPDEKYTGTMTGGGNLAAGDLIEIRYLRSNPDLSRPAGTWPILPTLVLFVGVFLLLGCPFLSRKQRNMARHQN